MPKINRDSRQRMIDRVRALRNKTEDAGATLEEAKQAMAMAADLMAEHDLSEGDLIDPERSPTDIAQATGYDQVTWYFNASRKVFWVTALANILARRVVGRCATYTSYGVDPGTGKRVRTIVFYGDKDRIHDALFLFEEWLETIRSQSVRLYGSWAGGKGNSYCMGFIEGMYEMLKAKEAEAAREARAQDAPKNALMLVRRRTITQEVIRYGQAWLRNNHGIRLGSGGASGARMDGAAYSAGHKAGSSATVGSATRRLR